ncbi:cell wall-binding repeat-containing protein [Candidatus Poriferisodalis sp.]|uniref:cell wall-binding repeat-containing protein n=1 Tax=Candidatus Poriferisodalis sp. TaxID=3101277 RepID=UPI003B02C508
MRSRRLWAVLAAVVLAGSVLGVVAGSPAGAANSAAEYLVDSNNDGRPDSRAFAGRDRYETALLLAKHFADGGEPAAVDTVVVASGESQIDAVAAAGLSRWEEAPVLLTRRDSLPRGVAEFVADQGVRKVYVAGGMMAVSDSVVEQLEGLASKPTVTRVSGADRYATAAAMAKLVGTSARWCDSDDDAVLLVNGDRSPFTSAVLAGPLSYGLEMPLLLTAAKTLPSATAEWISDNNIDRVVIIGDKTEVSEAVADEVTALGAKVDRHAGSDAAATSVAVAKLMWNCGSLGADKSRVALVSESSTADGVAAAPVMGNGISRDDSPVPILLVGAELPASVRDWLAATPAKNTDGTKKHLQVVAVGGTAAVSAAVVTAAVAAASSGTPLTATISVDAASRTGRAEGDPNSFKITFSDAIDTTGDWKADLGSMLYVNGVRVLTEEVTEDSDYPVAGTCAPGKRVTVTLESNLKAGDKVELRPNAEAAVGASGDMRRVGATSFTVPLKTTPAVPPPLEVIAIEGQKRLYLRTTMAMGRSDDVGKRNGKITVTSKRGAKVTVQDLTEKIFKSSDSQAYEPALTLTEAFDYNGDDDKTDTNEPAGSPYFLGAGDTVTVERGALVNGTAQSQRKRAVVTKRMPKPKITAVRIGRPDTGVNDDPTDDKKPGGLPADALPDAASGSYISLRPVAHVGDEIASFTDPRSPADPPGASRAIVWGSGDAKPARQLQIYGRWDGMAAGAKGNDWAVRTEFAKSYFPADSTDDVDIDVSVGANFGQSGGGVIRITFLAGAPTLADVAKALTANSDFTANFTVAYNCADHDVRLKVPASVSTESADLHWHRKTYGLQGGVSTVGFEVVYDEWHNTGRQTSELRNFVLATLVPRPGGWDVDDTSSRVGSDDVTGMNNFEDTSAQRYFAHGHVAMGPSKTWHLWFITGDASLLPGPRTGPTGGVLNFPGYFYDNTGARVNQWEGETLRTPGGIGNINWDGRFPYSFLDPNSSDQVEYDAATAATNVAGMLPQQIDDDKSGDPKKSKAAGKLTEQVEWAAPKQTVRVTSGSVPSHVTELPVN